MRGLYSEVGEERKANVVQERLDKLNSHHLLNDFLAACDENTSCVSAEIGG